MRDLTPIFYPITKRLREILVRKVQSGEDELDMAAWMGRAAIEYIGQGGMGYTFNSLEEGGANRYLGAVREIGYDYLTPFFYPVGLISTLLLVLFSLRSSSSVLWSHTWSNLVHGHSGA